VNPPPFICFAIIIRMTSNRLCTAILATIFLLVLTIQSGESIHCWVCDSSEDPRCGDHFDNHTIAYVDCDQTSRAGGKNATFCRKYVQSVKGDLKITRSCGWVNATGDNAGELCYQRSGSADIYTTHCACYSPGCNSATSLLPTAVGMVAVIGGVVNYLTSFVSNCH